MNEQKKVCDKMDDGMMEWTPEEMEEPTGQAWEDEEDWEDEEAWEDEEDWEDEEEWEDEEDWEDEEEEEESRDWGYADTPGTMDYAATDWNSYDYSGNSEVATSIFDLLY